MKQVASLRYGVIFKKAFSQPDVFTAFVKAVLDIDLEIDHVETEKSFNPLIGKVDLRFDLFAEDVKNRIIVDIQHARYEDHYDRFFHYHCAAILDLIDSSKSYRPDVRVFTIVVLTSGDRHKKDVLTIDCAPKDLDGNGVGEIAHKVVYLCPKYANEKTPASYKEWMDAIQDTLDEEVNDLSYHHAAIQKIFTTIEKSSISPKERADMIEEYNRAELARKEAMESWFEGVEKGLEKGREQGLEKGLEQGRAEGELLATQAIAKNLLATGVDFETIAKVTGLSVQEITDLRNEK
jgi:predicted transposase/invertase (TIGR01784 family)